MTFPQTYDAAYFPLLASKLPLIVSLNQISNHYPSHRHDCVEFSIVLSGSGTEWVNGHPHPMKAGTVTFIMPYQYHEIRNDGNSPLLLFNCMFGLELLLAAGQEQELTRILLPDLDEDRPHSFYLSEKSLEKAQRLANELQQEFSGNSHYRSSMLRAKLTELLIFIERNRSSSSQAPTKTPLQQGITTKLLMYLNMHYKEELSLERVASHFHISSAYVCTLFKKYTGRTYNQLLHETRLRHACALLVASDLPVNDVALETGFQSVQTFFRVFKRERSMTPHSYRKQYKKS